MIDKVEIVAKNYYKVDCKNGEDLLEKIYVLGFKRGVQKQKADKKEGFWQQYTYAHQRGFYSIIHRCSICDFHPCDHNLGQYKFCPSCGNPMTAEPEAPIMIDVDEPEKREKKVAKDISYNSAVESKI